MFIQNITSIHVCFNLILLIGVFHEALERNLWSFLPFLRKRTVYKRKPLLKWQTSYWLHCFYNGFLTTLRCVIQDVAFCRHLMRLQGRGNLLGSIFLASSSLWLGRALNFRAKLSFLLSLEAKPIWVKSKFNHIMK